MIYPSKVYLPTAFLPSVAYMRYIAHADEVYIYTGESYRKQTYRNRADLMTPNGRASMSIPVEKYDYPPPTTSTIHLSEHGEWRERHLRTIESSYGSSPFLEHFIDDIKGLLTLDYEHETLISYNHRWLAFLCEHLDLKLPSLTDTLPVDAVFVSEVCARDYEPESSRFERYWQVYEERWGFVPNLSVLDLLLNTGNEAILYLQSR